MSFLAGLFGGGSSGYEISPFYSATDAALKKEADILAGKGDKARELRDKSRLYMGGNIGLEDALENLWDTPVAREQLFLDPTTGSRAAADQIRMNPILGQVYGKDGSFERAGAEEEELASRGFSLQPEDYEAYGQASGDIARLFGQQEQNLAQALANRGLSSADSGAALKGYAGLYGNKNEQLASAQRNIANDRMRMNLERLGQTRNYLSNLTGLGQQAIQDQFSRNMAGAQSRRGSMADQYEREFRAHQELQKNRQAKAGMDMQASQPGLLGSISQGIMGGVSGGLSSGIGGQVKGLFGGGSSGGANPNARADNTLKTMFTA